VEEIEKAAAFKGILVFVKCKNALNSLVILYRPFVGNAYNEHTE
jgi:hypothetical protein